MKAQERLMLAAALLCAALPLHAAGSGKPAANEAAAGDRDALLSAVEKSPDLPGSAPALETSARLLLKKTPDDYAGFLALCKALRVSGRAQESLPNCKRAMELDPTSYPSYRELGLAYAASGNSRRAAETLQQGVELSSSSAQAYYTLANVLEKHGEAARAHSYYQKGLALPLRSDYYRALMRAGAMRTAKAAGQAAEQRAAGKSRPRTAVTAAPPPSAAAQLPACLEKFKAAPADSDPAAALALGDACLKLGPRDAGLAAGRAPLMVRLGRYEEGVKEYERAAALYGAKDPMSGFCRIKAAETWTKLGDPAKAIAQYKLALAVNPKDLNALRGMAAAQEARSDAIGALATYETILKLDPSDEKARARREEMKADAITPEQMLEDMKLRQAVDSGKTALTPDDVKLFKAMKAAEIAGGVDYVKARAASAQGLLLRQESPDGIKFKLTGAGYKAYLSLATHDAIKMFEGQQIGMREIFQLRDLAGAQLFDGKGQLTQEGITAWRNAAGGGKTWLLPYEPVPQSPKALQAESDMKQFASTGYSEISEPEYLWLLRATDCPEELLTQQPLSMKIISDGTRRRYFMCFDMSGVCMNGINNKLPSYIGKYRAGDSDLSDSKTSTAFFGSGAIKKHKFCENGKIWMGP